MPPSPTIWPLEAHTRGKHLVLREYMKAWLPIMTRWNGRVLFIDAFAGPGEYLGGEHGSPMIAMRALTEHSARDRITADILYLFIEERVDRAEHLQQLLETAFPEGPPLCRYRVIPGTFDETLNEVLDRLDEQRVSLAPAFVMIDPFGVSDTPMATIARILANPKSEVYVSVMYDAINRFLEHPHFAPHLTKLFGCEDWQKAFEITGTIERQIFLFDLYKQQLKVSGAKQVLHFELYEGQRLVYAIFFGTGDTKGCDKMKQAIWKVAPFGDYRFWGGRSGQLAFGDEFVDYSVFMKDLYSEFADRDWVRIEEVIRFAESDRTDFHSGHLKVKTLRPMEEMGLLSVREGTRKRPSTFPDGTVLRFVRAPS